MADLYSVLGICLSGFIQVMGEIMTAF